MVLLQRLLQSPATDGTAADEVTAQDLDQAAQLGLPAR